MKTTTSSGINIHEVYSESAESEKPGEYPFTRGIQSNMYRGRLWTMRQYAGFGSAKESNRRYRHLLDCGQTGLSVAFDLPTQMGYDSDHIMASGEVGKVGVAIASIEDMEILLDAIPLDRISTSMTINSTAGILLSLYIAVAKKRGIPIDKLQGTIQNDLLKEYLARGTYIYPPQPSLRIITDIFAYCAENLPKWNTISISGYHIREAGSTAVQEVAFTLANAITYVEAALTRGLNVDDFAGRLSFFFNVHNNFFEEIAKFRAARKLWARIMREKFGAKKERSWKLRFHSQTAGSTLTAQQPENNVVRVAYQAMAAVLGGTQSLHTNSQDEALGLPTEEAATLALRTQQILALETGAPQTADPLGGSYLVESLTSEIATQVEAYLKAIADQGGVLACIENGWLKNEIETAAYAFQKDFEQEKEIIVGVNRYKSSVEPPQKISKVSESVAEEQIRRLQAFKEKRDDKKVQKQLQTLKNAAEKDTNLMPLFIECVENHITLGEISATLRKVFGQYRERIEF